jgi:hypothetical protein
MNPLESIIAQGAEIARLRKVVGEQYSRIAALEAQVARLHSMPVPVTMAGTPVKGGGK